MTREGVKERIAKILELANNNPNEAEAQAAALKAQALLAQYKIDMSEIDDIEDEIEDIVEGEMLVGKGNVWRYSLMTIIGRNFRCGIFKRGSKKLCFLGFETDVDIAISTFEYLFDTGNRLAAQKQREMKREGYDTRLIKNTFLSGYLDGIASVLDKQCTALMIVTPKEVKDAMSSLNLHRGRSTSMKVGTNHAVYSSGYDSGRNSMNARSISG